MTSIICFIINTTHTMEQDNSLVNLDQNSIYIGREVKKDILTHFNCIIDGCRFTHGKQRTIQNHIKLHIAYAATKKKESPKFYSCSKCDFLSLKKQTAKRHNISHSNEKRHACNKCSKTFKYCDSLKRHKKNQHSKLKSSIKK